MALKPDTKSRLFRFAGRSGARLVSFVRDTSTLVVEPSDAAERIAANHPFIFAMWHGQFMMLPALHTTDINVSAMVAKHGDAIAIAELLGRFRISVVLGAGAGERAKDRGGASALRTALRLLSRGTTLAMTADVPPGPARIAGPGIVTLARMSGRPIIPFAAATSRYVAFKTWSRMTVNLPFGRLAYVIGDPIFVPHDLDEEGIEAWRMKVSDALNSATRRAYELAGADPTRATPPKPADLSTAPVESGLRLKLYRTATRAMKPIAPVLLRIRERQGKEDPRRRNERYGIASRARPEGKLAWIHAASVGETNAVLPLMHALAQAAPGLGFVLTTGTVTSAALAAARLPSFAIHQVAPLDTPEYAERFLDHWRPDLAVFTESEIWPNLILETSRRKIPLALVNARMSPRSFRRWQRNAGVARPLFSAFDVILAQNERLVRAFKSLGGRNVLLTGNLKIDSPAPPVDEGELARLTAAVGNRPRLTVASTHEGEEEIVAAAHATLKDRFPDFLTIIAPRHPERGDALAAALRARGLAVAQRSSGAMPAPDTDIYLADTIGELGLFYTLSPVAFIGGSLVEHGGQNPIEAVALGAAVLTGPHHANFRDTYRALLRHKGAAEVTSAETLAERVAALVSDEAERERMRRGARTAMLTLGGALERTLKALRPYVAASGELTGVS